ncbi:hypothetical protein CDD82_1972 [Ophiocordyceps australis]|uniref:Uncharacterized protein n=1 Tax=Ophiocordyceps australis TaxID=1399860 RepID=A0A2C5Y4S8_9HYPO|nr:hypothetical protein CDD82_1972 [Ophiocordyceps australis]
MESTLYQIKGEDEDMCQGWKALKSWTAQADEIQRGPWKQPKAKVEVLWRDVRVSPSSASNRMQVAGCNLRVCPLPTWCSIKGLRLGEQGVKSCSPDV